MIKSNYRCDYCGAEEAYHWKIVDITVNMRPDHYYTWLPRDAIAMRKQFCSWACLEKGVHRFVMKPNLMPHDRVF